MTPVSMTTDRLRRLLVEIRKRQLPFEVCLATDLRGPGGGVYVKSGSPVSSRHILWIESRNPSHHLRPTFVEVFLYKKGDSDVDLGAEFGLGADDIADATDRVTQARRTADAVGAQAGQTAKVVTRLHERLGRRYTHTQLTAPEAVASMQEFEREYRRLHQVVRRAVDEFLGGNTMVLDFIVDYELERPAVHHAVRVAALSTELLVRAHPERCENEDFRRQIVDLFLAGFLHDGGMWDEPWCFAEGHEARGAALATGAVGEQASAELVEKLILFHSDLGDLALGGPLSFVRTDNEDLYRREVGGDAISLDDDERTLALGLALAETWVTEIDEVQFRYRNHRMLINDLVQHAHPGAPSLLLSTLCNMDVEVVAPRRAWVTLSGVVPILSPGEARERYVRVPVDGYTAGSLGHDEDGNSPHLILLFARERGGGRRALEALKPGDDALWERAAGRDHRCYVPGGRFKNLIDWQVTGFFTPEEYDAILAGYERQAVTRGLLQSPPATGG